MRIEDAELADLWRQESAEHLQSLENGLLQMEKDPASLEPLTELFRAAHSLKGAARVVGAENAAAVVHRFEDALGKARKGTLVLSVEIIDCLYKTLDAVRAYCEEALTGEPAPLDLNQVLAGLDATLQTAAASDAVSRADHGAVSAVVESPQPSANAHPNDAPVADAPVADAPVADASVADVPASDMPNSDPAGDVPASNVPAADSTVGEPPPAGRPAAAAASAEQLPATPASPRAAEPVAAAEPSSDESPQIADEELRSLFQAETKEHIECLERGLLVLEQHPQDAEQLEELFRAAHSLKGAARMVAVDKVAAIAHLFEDALSAARSGERQLSAEAIDRLYTAIDDLRDFCDEAITGRRVITDLETVLARLADGEPAETRLPATANPAAVAVSKQPLAQPPAAGSDRNQQQSTQAVATRPAAPPPALNIDTIRVASSKLDSLMSQAGELAVTRARIDNWVNRIDSLLKSWEKWNSDSYDLRLPNSDREEANLTAAERRAYLRYLRNDAERREQFGAILKQFESEVQEDDARVSALASKLEDGIREVRMLPLSTVFSYFPRMVRDLAREQGKDIEFEVLCGQTSADKRILEELKDPLTHMLRNAIDHGIEEPQARIAAGKRPVATLRLSAYQRGVNVVVEVQDDGGGVDVAAVRETAIRRRIATREELDEMSDLQIQRLIFAPGFSTQQIVTDISGRGVGMDVVRDNIENHLRGAIELESSPGRGSTFRLVLPLTVATRRVLLVRVGKAKFAFPVESVQRNRLISRKEVFSLQGRGNILEDKEPIPVVKLSEVLELHDESLPGAATGSDEEPSAMECLILREQGRQFGFLVDELLEEQEVVVKPHGEILRRVRNVSGSTILKDGEVCITLNPHDLIRSLQSRPTAGSAEGLLQEASHKKVILLAEDSIVTRTMEKRILESAGFEVITAIDGQEALQKLAANRCDAVVSDVEMPNLTGLELTAKIREQPDHRNLPIILLTSLSSDTDRKRGMEVGADAYLTKPGFDQTTFIDTVKRLV